MAILDNLVAHWQLEETSGTRQDAHTGNIDLTDNNTVLYAAGKLGTNAASFEDANSESLSRSDEAAISCGADTAWTIAAWIYCDELPDSRAIFTKTNSWASGQRWCYGLSTDATYHPLARAGNNTSSAAAVWGSALTTAQWYFIVAWHDPVANEVGISVNNGTPVTTAWTGGTYDNAYNLVLAGFSGGGTNFFKGRIDSASLWFRTLTSDERTTLYNSGNGLDYPFTTGTTAVGAERAASWNVSAAVGAARQAIWNDSATVTASRQGIWNVSAAVGAARQSVWDDRSLTASERQALWNLAASVGAERAALWDVLVTGTSAVGAERAALWEVLAIIGAGRDLRWNVQITTAAFREGERVNKQPPAQPTRLAGKWPLITEARVNKQPPAQPAHLAGKWL